jgi:hypothetical protein
MAAEELGGMHGAQEQGTSGNRIKMPIAIPGMPREVPAERVLWYGGLAALAGLGVIDWPVAAVVAAGTYIARRQASGKPTVAQP